MGARWTASLGRSVHLRCVPTGTRSTGHVDHSVGTRPGQPHSPDHNLGHPHLTVHFSTLASEVVASSEAPRKNRSAGHFGKTEARDSNRKFRLGRPTTRPVLHWTRSQTPAGVSLLAHFSHPARGRFHSPVARTRCHACALWAGPRRNALHCFYCQGRRSSH